MEVATFLFDREDLTEVTHLQPPSPQPAMGFGWSSVSVRDNRILVTAATLQQSRQPGDLNGDGMVGSADLDIIRDYWGQTVTPGDLLAGDPSGDGYVGSADLNIIREYWGDSLPPAVAGSAYLFDAEDARLLHTFAEPASAEYGFFGMSAAVVGDEVLVSAPNASLVISEDGAVYRFDMGIETTTTDASGDYSFTELEEGTYRVRQRASGGYYRQTAPADPSTYTIEITQGTQEFTGNDFGLGLDWLTLTCDPLTDEGSPATLTMTTNPDTPIDSWRIDWGDGGGAVDVSAPASGFLPLDWGQRIVQVGNHRRGTPHRRLARFQPGERPRRNPLRRGDRRRR